MTKKSLVKHCRLMQYMNNEQWIDTEKQCSLLEAAINTDITDAFGLMLSDVEKSVNSEILKEEEERRLEEMRI